MILINWFKSNIKKYVILDEKKSNTNNTYRRHFNFDNIILFGGITNLSGISALIAIPIAWLSLFSKLRRTKTDFLRKSCP